jgi:hypothetical protein
MLEYKVITQRDKSWRGAFEPQRLTELLNAHARDGWRLAEGFIASSLWKSSRMELMLILERTRTSTSEPTTDES